MSTHMPNVEEIRDAIRRGDTAAFMEAIKRGETETVRMFLDNGADASAADQDGVTALMEAARNGHTEIAQMLLDNGADARNPGILNDAIRRGNTEIVQMLLDNGADPNAMDATGIPALRWAILGEMLTDNDNTEIIPVLLDNGADVNATGRDDGITALMHAAMRGDTETARLLLDNGADPTITDKEGRTAAEIAREYSHDNLADTLSSAEKEHARTEQTRREVEQEYLRDIERDSPHVGTSQTPDSRDRDLEQKQSQQDLGQKRSELEQEDLRDKVSLDKRLHDAGASKYFEPEHVHHIERDGPHVGTSQTPDSRDRDLEQKRSQQDLGQKQSELEQEDLRDKLQSEKWDRLLKDFQEGQNGTHVKFQCSDVAPADTGNLSSSTVGGPQGSKGRHV